MNKRTIEWMNNWTKVDVFLDIESNKTNEDKQELTELSRDEVYGVLLADKRAPWRDYIMRHAVMFQRGYWGAGYTRWLVVERAERVGVTIAGGGGGREGEEEIDTR